MMIVLHTVLVTVPALLVVLWSQHESRKPKAVASVFASVVPAAMPNPAIGLAACAPVPPPAVKLATRSLHLQPLVASVVGVRRLHELVLSQIGGLYGP